MMRSQLKKEHLILIFNSKLFHSVQWKGKNKKKNSEIKRIKSIAPPEDKMINELTPKAKQLPLRIGNHEKSNKTCDSHRFGSGSIIF